MTRNPHRTSWLGTPDAKGRTCGAPGCGVVAKTVRAQQEHADVHEPGLLRAHHLAVPAGDEA